MVMPNHAVIKRELCAARGSLPRHRSCVCSRANCCPGIGLLGALGTLAAGGLGEVGEVVGHADVAGGVGDQAGDVVGGGLPAG